VNAVDVLQNSCPYPFVAGGRLFNGTILEQLNICGKCETKDCAVLAGKPFAHFTCSKGFSCYPISAFNDKFVLNGLIASENNTAIAGKRRKPYRRHVLSHQDVVKFYSQIRRLADSVSAGVSEEVRGSVAYLHDIRTSVGIVLSWCQEVIGEGDGVTFEEKLRGSSDELVGLYQSINLLKEQLNLADIIPNPSAITYGVRSQSNINGFLWKMHKIFEPRFRRKGLQIHIEGFTKAKIEAYNSIQFIPLILLDNALKYSSGGRTTFIRLHENRSQDLIEVTVSSYGRVVPGEFWERIFEKYVRGPGAKEINPEGMGLGLYLAQQIAAAHGFTIRYKSVTSDGVSGMNDFSFQMPIVGFDF
jgi:signal transduction histidine kinase